jgi:hypothetical protein
MHWCTKHIPFITLTTSIHKRLGYMSHKITLTFTLANKIPTLIVAPHPHLVLSLFFIVFDFFILIWFPQLIQSSLKDPRRLHFIA